MTLKSRMIDSVARDRCAGIGFSIRSSQTMITAMKSPQDQR